MTPNETEKRLNAGIDYRSMKLAVRAAGGDDTEENKEPNYIVEGYATTFNEPYTLWEGPDFRLIEQVEATAFNETDLSDVIVQYDHAGHVYARTSNNTLKLEKDEHGLKCIIDLSGTSEGRKLYEEIKGGYTNKMSFGFTIDDLESTYRTGADGKEECLDTIKKIGKLYDVSAVSLPANDGTELSARKRFNTEVQKRAAEAVAEQQPEPENEVNNNNDERNRLALELSFLIK